MMSSSDSLATPQTGQSSTRHISTPASSVATPYSDHPRHIPKRLQGATAAFPPVFPMPNTGDSSATMDTPRPSSADGNGASGEQSEGNNANAKTATANLEVGQSLGDFSYDSFVSSILQEEARLRWDSDVELKKVSKRLLFSQKVMLISGLVTLNGCLITVGNTYNDAYVLWTILLSCNTMLQGLMIVCLVGNAIYNLIRYLTCPKPENIPEKLERMVWLLPCYNESPREVTRSLESLVAQVKLDEHPKCIFIVVDGDVRGQDMKKTTQEYLLQDILEPGQCRVFQNGYRARDGLYMPVKVQTGYHKGIPYVCVAKRYNQGKRDSLCFARSFVWHYTQRSENKLTMFHPDLFDHIGSAMMSFGLDGVDQMAGMDADTVFAPDCIYEMLVELRKNLKLVGVCGHVCVDFEDSNWNFWSLYQSVEYSQTQGLRRLFQSRITGKVNCLPGCCQLIRVTEATFGDEVLRERFGYCPKPNDNMTQQIMGNYSEDSIHASIIFSIFPESQTAQALKAKAYTTVPKTWPVFLSQRKRWALGSISNEFLMVFRRGIILIERVQSIIATITWAITPFIIAALVELVLLFYHRGTDVFNEPVFLGLIAVLWMRYAYAFSLIFWLPRSNLERLQYLVGFFIHIFTSPFMNVIVLVYSLLYSDDFKWGKTRVVVQDENDEEGDGDGCGGRNTTWMPGAWHDTRPGRERPGWEAAQKEKEREKEADETAPLNNPGREKEETAPLKDIGKAKEKGKEKEKEEEEEEEEEEEKEEASEGTNNLAPSQMSTRVPMEGAPLPA